MSRPALAHEDTSAEGLLWATRGWTERHLDRQTPQWHHPLLHPLLPASHLPQEGAVTLRGRLLQADPPALLGHILLLFLPAPDAGQLFYLLLSLRSFNARTTESSLIPASHPPFTMFLHRSSLMISLEDQRSWLRPPNQEPTTGRCSECSLGTTGNHGNPRRLPGTTALALPGERGTPSEARWRRHRDAQPHPSVSLLRNHSVCP